MQATATPTDAPNPYETTEGFFKMPEGRKWGSTSAVDVAPDGSAYILDDTILRARFREGYGKEVFMEKGKTYKLDFTPMSTANTFMRGHRIRVEVTSSSFPKYGRNLNTGGRNEFEKEGIVANNVVRHTSSQPSYIVLPIVK